MTTVYEILRRPLVTEKSNYLVNRLNQYVFEVDRNASSTAVKEAVETLFEVTVLRVNIINVPTNVSRRARNHTCDS